MAGKVSKDLGTGLMQAMLAIKTIRPQRDRLLQLRRQFQQLIAGDDAAGIQDLASHLFMVYIMGIETGARYLNACLTNAIKSGVRIAFNTSLGVIPDEQQYDVLLAQPLPARPATQSEAFSFLEAAFNALRLAQTHHLSRCIELLISERPPNVARGEVPRVMKFGYPDDPVAAAAEHIAKNGLPREVKTSRPTGATRPVKDTGKAPHVASSLDVDLALTYLHRVCSLVSLAVSHIDLAIAVISSIHDPDKFASLAEFTDSVGYISEFGKRCYPPTED